MTPTAVLLAAAEQEEEFNFYTVSPGMPGFVTFFLFAVVGWLLFRSMTRHVRKVQLRAEAERAERAAAEARAAGADAGAPADGEAPDAGEAARGADDAAAGRP